MARLVAAGLDAAEDPGRGEPGRGTRRLGQRTPRAGRHGSLRIASPDGSGIRPILFHKVPVLRLPGATGHFRSWPLILDRVLSLRLRSLAAAVGRDRLRSGWLGRGLGLGRLELVASPLRCLPILHARSLPPSCRYSSLAVRRGARPAGVRPVQCCLDRIRLTVGACSLFRTARCSSRTDAMRVAENNISGDLAARSERWPGQTGSEPWRGVHDPGQIVERAGGTRRRGRRR